MTGPQNNGLGLLSAAFPFLVASFLSGSNLFAQDDAADEPVEEIVIIGSRIPRRDFSAPSPVVTLDSVDIRLAGTTTVEDALNALPQFIPDGDKTLNSAGGMATINLRGLGRHRTLVMLNGRRFAASEIGGAVDVNNIPAVLIDRVEVVTGGASAAYGSDAVVGVVNFVMNDEFDGLAINAQYDTTHQKDGQILDFSVSAGTAFADGRGHISGFFNYNDRDEIRATERAFTSTTIIDDTDTGQLIEAGSFSVPGGMIVFPDTIIGGEALAETIFEPDGTLRMVDDPADLYNFNADNFLQVPLRRYVAASFINYDFTPRVSGVFELLYARNEIVNQLAPTPANRFVSVAIDNPFIPDETRQAFSDSFDADDDGFAEFFLLKRLQEVGDRQFENRRTVWRALLGVDGAFGESWRWDAYYSWTDTDLDPTWINAVSASRYEQAVQYDPATGGCVDPSNGCVPLNIFGAGNISPEGVDFIRFDTIRNVHRVKEQVASLGVSGDVAQLPGGPLGMAFGLEWRRLEGRFASDPAPLSQEVLGVGGFQPAFGAVEVHEAFAELLVPLLLDKPYAEYLAIEAGARRSDYNTAGTTDTWKIGIEWIPIDGLRLRAMYQSAIRAPNVLEIYEEPVDLVFSAFGPNWDLCSARNDPVGNGLTDVCIAQGMDPSLVGVFEVSQPNFVNFSFGGNLALRPEDADSITAGVVIQPTSVEGLSISVDYFDIEIEDAIQGIGTGSLDICFAEKNPGSRFCSAYTRDATGRIAEANIYPTNVAMQRSEGVDFQVLYTVESTALSLFSDVAVIDLSLHATHYLSNGSKGTPLSPFFECAGFFGRACSFSSFGTLPEWKATTRTTYSTGPLSASIRWRWIDGMKNSATTLRKVFKLPPPVLAIPEIGSTSYFDLSATWDISDTTQVYGGVHNLFDNDPPLLAGESPGLNTDTATFDAIGRRFFLGITLSY